MTATKSAFAKTEPLAKSAEAHPHTALLLSSFWLSGVCEIPFPV
jgi:hypothetical protein